jgi:hypothetical protein
MKKQQLFPTNRKQIEEFQKFIDDMHQGIVYLQSQIVSNQSDHGYNKGYEAGCYHGGDVLRVILLKYGFLHPMFKSITDEVPTDEQEE